VLRHLGVGVDLADDRGEPEFLVKDIPPVVGDGLPPLLTPELYHGEGMVGYSIVGTEQTELSDDDLEARYSGTAGVSIGSTVRQAAFALRFGEIEPLISDSITSESKVIYVRDIVERVREIAPFLEFDPDPYPVLIDERVKYVVDAYTTTPYYPYAQEVDAAEVDSASGGTFNYIRNSVKAVVDAYDGTVTLYAWEPDEPVLKTWTKAFGGVVTPMSEAPEELVAHFRYPEDLFKVQRAVLSRYHVTDPASFYNGQDFWTIPIDPSNRAANALQPPYYLTLRMPGTTEPKFSLTTTFAPQKRQTLAALMAVDATPGPTYGTIRVLQLPRNTTVPGPTQVQNNFESEPAIAEQLTLLRRGGADVEFGNLLSLPVSGGVLYVEPVYVRASQGQGFPLLRKVLVGYGDRSVLANTLPEALSAVFEGAGDAGTGGDSGTGGTGGGTGDGGGGQTEDAEADLTRALADAQAAYEAGQEALSQGDFSAYGKAQDDLKDALDRAAAAQRRLIGDAAAGEAGQAPAEGESPAPESPAPDASVPATPAA
jgi:hypothetical protein